MLIWTSTCRSRGHGFLFLDRDGIINVDRSDYVKTWDEFTLYPDVISALQMAMECGINVILVSNQSGLGRRIIGWDDFWKIHKKMVERLRREGVEFLATFYCPHRPDEGCSCRKPAPGMLLAAAELWDIPLEDSAFVGDKPSDVGAAMNAGCQPVLLARGDVDMSPELDRFPPGSYRCFADLRTAVRNIVG